MYLNMNIINKWLIISPFLTIVMSCRGGNIIYSGVTHKEKALILEVHNNLRALVAKGQVPGQPSAENMREIVWDNELAARAQEWANECQFKHDPSRDVERFTMGQNLAIIWSTDPLSEDDGDFPSRIQSWFNEVQKYAFGASWSSKTGHYSQLVWGETNLVGCGFSYYKDARKYNKLFVCNYGPGGNVIGSKPYQVGYPSCNSYGLKPSPKYQGLCIGQTSNIENNPLEIYTFKTTFNNKNKFDNGFQRLPHQPAILHNQFAHNNGLKTFYRHQQNAIHDNTPKLKPQQIWQTHQKSISVERKNTFNHFGYDWSAYFHQKLGK